MSLSSEKKERGGWKRRGRAFRGQHTQYNSFSPSLRFDTAPLLLAMPGCLNLGV